MEAQVRIVQRDNRSGSVVPFGVGAIIEDHTGHRFGVLDLELEDAEMSRYTLISCQSGALYRNMPHYTMRLINCPTPETVQLAIATLAAEDA